LEIEEYITGTGRSPFESWITTLDESVVNRLDARLRKRELDDHYRPVKSLGGGLYELKFRNIGGGLRIYFGKRKSEKMIILLGETKRNQTNDIDKARQYWKDYLMNELRG
jgi:putative addiction module killer protein